jgi:hypothetical protein
MMKERIEKIKQHIRDNREIYIAAGAGLVAGAGITLLITRGRHAGIQGVPGTAENSVFVRPFNFLSPNTILTVFEREGRGHPGYIIQCLETGETFPSQVQAANVMNIPETLLSAHLRGKFPDVDGLHFERLGLMS